MPITFVNRKKEIELLNKFLNKRNSFIIIYGRRRIGKTTLIKKVVENKDFLYLFCEEGYKRNLNNLKNIVKEKFSININFEDYKSFFNLIKNIKKDKIVVIFDEFQNLIENNNNLIEFQYIIDEIIRNSNIHFVVLGSSINFMKKLLEYKNPLYGRRDLSIKLDYLSFFDSMKFFNLNIEEIIKIFGITGGVPLYLRLFKKFDDVKDLAFNKFGFLYQEIDFLLSSEFKEFANYKLILSAIAKGKNSFNEISNYTGIQKSNLFIYLENLINIGLINRIIPINESVKTKKSRYFISDNYVSFYFNFIEKYKEYVELDNLIFYKKFLEEYNSYLGFIFENITKEFIIKKFGKKINKLGKWWDKEKEIDLIGLNEKKKEVYFFEIKWKNLDLKKVKEIIEDLKDKSKYFNWNFEKRKEYFCVVAKNINKKAKEWLKSNGFIGFDLRDFEKIID